jgi:ABC-type lipopolysaccharide export system ATPase subunit
MSDTGFDILSLFDDGPEPQLDISQDIALRVRNLQVKFRRQHVLKGVNFDVKRGEVLGFVGASGAGKSVLLRTMIGLIQPTSGTIEVFGQEFSRAKELRERCKLIAMYFSGEILEQRGHALRVDHALAVVQHVNLHVRDADAKQPFPDRMQSKLNVRVAHSHSSRGRGGGGSCVGFDRRKAASARPLSVSFHIGSPAMIPPS